MSKKDSVLDRQWFRLKVLEAEHHQQLTRRKKEAAQQELKAISVKEVTIVFLSFTAITSSVMGFIVYFPGVIQ